jgi:excisionase family DNA binding protein
VITINGEDFVTTSEASEITGYSISHIGKLVSQKRIEAIKIGRNWAINRTSLQNYVKNAAAPVVTRGKKSTGFYMRLKAMQLGHKLEASVDGRVWCKNCREMVTAIYQENLQCLGSD